MRKCLLSLVIVLAIVVTCVHQTEGSFCKKSGIKLTRMFKIQDRIYFGSSSHLYAFDFKTKVHHKVVEKSEFVGGVVPVQVAVQFDVAGACSPHSSNVGFCEHSQVFADLVVLMGEGKLSKHSMSKSKKLEVYQRPQGKKSVLPSIKDRLRASVDLLFNQLADNPLLKFTGLTYDHFTDTLYMAATVLQQSIVHDSSWGQGSYVLFSSSFSSGVMQDAFVVAAFNQSVVGLIDYNGALYALTEDQSITELHNDSFTGKAFSHEVFFGCAGAGSPLLVAPKQPNLEVRQSDLSVMPSLSLTLLPSFSGNDKVIESALLTGTTFVLIVVVLAALLVMNVACNSFILFGMIKSRLRGFQESLQGEDKPK